MEPITEIETTPHQPEATPPARRRRFTKKRVIIAVVALFVIAGAVGGYWFWQQTTKKPVASQTATPTQGVPLATVPPKDMPADLKAFITPTTGETWLATPKDMAPQGWIDNEYKENFQGEWYDTPDKVAEAMAQLKPTYKEVGSRAGNKIVFVEAPDGGPGSMTLLFEIHPDGKVAIIMRPQNGLKKDDAWETAKKEFISSKVQIIDTSTYYDSLSVPSTITLDNGEVLKRPDTFWVDTLGARGSDAKKIKVMDLGGSALYRFEAENADTKLTNVGYAVQTPMQTYIIMQYAPHAASLEGYTFDNGKTAQVKDSDGKMVYDGIHAIARGCGGSLAGVTRSEDVKDSDLVQVGKSDAGKPVYMLKDKNSTLAKKAYEEYKAYYTDAPVSLDAFWAEHALIFMKNASNEILVYIRDTFGPSGGCAKPVVYLYPTTARLVDVRVGAKVTISEPYYPEGGWRNVWAQPNGQLTYQGSQYESLFWEGTGFGSYPSITSGTVVKRADAESTMRRQLAQQGLNPKETADFMEFWAPKIPDQPYIRLTWLTTAQMDQLAPLSVIPRPDTVKRVFLDMSGFDNPISLPTQKLQSFERRGFTVVEWGGLSTMPRQ